jgi:hypothetical protein
VVVDIIHIEITKNLGKCYKNVLIVKTRNARSTGVLPSMFRTFGLALCSSNLNIQVFFANVRLLANCCFAAFLGATIIDVAFLNLCGDSTATGRTMQEAKKRFWFGRPHE